MKELKNKFILYCSKYIAAEDRHEEEVVCDDMTSIQSCIDEAKKISQN